MLCFIKRIIQGFMRFFGYNSDKTDNIIGEDYSLVENCKVEDDIENKIENKIIVNNYIEFYSCPMETGATGATGLNGVDGSGGMTLYLAAFPVADNEFVGLGTISDSFIRNTVAIPQNATITGIVLDIRDETLTSGQTVSAEIIRSITCGFSFEGTGIKATVVGPNNSATPNCSAFKKANFPVNKFDLLSVQITRTGSNEALQDGVAVTVLFTMP